MLGSEELYFLRIYELKKGLNGSHVGILGFQDP